MRLFNRGAAQRGPRHYTTPAGDKYTLYADMLQQPHLLIAGATGSGKSVVINGLIYTALYNFPGAGPEGVQLILIDPKRVELAQWQAVPHCIQYADDPAPRLDALKYAVNLCDSRYKRMQRAGERLYSGGDVYIVIDELADLMLTQRRDAAPLIQRLAQIGRAARIHVIAATQTPIRDVIPTPIKCNFDARVGLRTRSAQDSRNIIGRAGLELLPRYGQGIYYTADGEQLYNIPLIPADALQARVDYWTRQR